MPKGGRLNIGAPSRDDSRRPVFEFWLSTSPSKCGASTVDLLSTDTKSRWHGRPHLSAVACGHL